MAAKPIPEGYHTLTPYLAVEDTAKAIDFYKEAFGAEELFRIAAPDGRIVHSELTVCDATVMLGDPDARLYDEPRQLGACTAGLHLIVDDNAAVLARALAAGCEQIQPPTEMFYGANSASVRVWSAGCSIGARHWFSNAIPMM